MFDDDDTDFVLDDGLLGSSSTWTCGWGLIGRVLVVVGCSFFKPLQKQKVIDYLWKYKDLIVGNYESHDELWLWQMREGGQKDDIVKCQLE